MKSAFLKTGVCVLSALLALSLFACTPTDKGDENTQGGGETPPIETPEDTPSETPDWGMGEIPIG